MKNKKTPEVSSDKPRKRYVSVDELVIKNNTTVKQDIVEKSNRSLFEKQLGKAEIKNMMLVYILVWVGSIVLLSQIILPFYLPAKLGIKSLWQLPFISIYIVAILGHVGIFKRRLILPIVLILRVLEFLYYFFVRTGLVNWKVLAVLVVLDVIFGAIQFVDHSKYEVVDIPYDRNGRNTYDYGQ